MCCNLIEMVYVYNSWSPIYRIISYITVLHRIESYRGKISHIAKYRIVALSIDMVSYRGEA